MWHYITMHNIHAKTQGTLQFLPNNSSKFCYLQLGKDNSYLDKINKSLITAGYYFEIISRYIREIGILRALKLKFCRISYKVL